MSFLIPDDMFVSITAITPDYLRQNGVNTLLLDVDNTLSEHHSGVAAEGVEDWLVGVRLSGINVMIVSNSKEERIKPFADSLSLPFEALSLKPLTKGIGRAIKRMRADKNHTALIGDQIFTDVLGCRFAGIRVLFVRYIKKENGLWFRVRRFFESIILKNCEYKGVVKK